ncbi:MAG: FkbM family methyltransferase [Planctomycetota bacterium]
MLNAIHRAMLSNRYTRRLQRQMLLSLKNRLGYSDPYADLADAVGKGSPDAVLDIGSHVGKTISRILDFSTLGSTPVHGFEPTPEAFDLLHKAYGEHPQVTLHQIALSDQTTMQVMHRNQNGQTNSLLENGIGNQTELPDATAELGQFEVQSVRLDDWYAEKLGKGKIIIKCDVQGAEGQLIQGGESTFENHVLAFLSEAQIAPMYEGQATFDELHQTLTRKFDFSLANIYPCFRSPGGRALQTDALWLRNDLFHA